MSLVNDSTRRWAEYTECAQSKTTGGVEAEKSDKTWRKQGEEGRERRQTQQEWCGKVLYRIPSVPDRAKPHCKNQESGLKVGRC
ncbi:hypothetical protein HZ326_17788 [Fusarium oxysporum f. sp. albedinis]|nr:hypothetical protein HZ326_17788 [Fusarium oxysporum f. sp. albedinis]